MPDCTTEDCEHAEPFRLRDIGWAIAGLIAVLAWSLWIWITGVSLGSISDEMGNYDG